MNELILKIGECVERGKVNKISPYPVDMKGLEGAEELTQQALGQGVTAEAILQSCIDGMVRIGDKFGRNEAFVPEMLMAAKTMKTVTAHLTPFFKPGNVQNKGTLIIGTVDGDLHDIGKNLVSTLVEGNGWKVIDLGVDVKTRKFIEKIQENPNCIIGLSALLTITMANMSKTVKEIKTLFPTVKIIVGGSALSIQAAQDMGADKFGRNPQEAVAWLNSSLKETV